MFTKNNKRQKQKTKKNQEKSTSRKFTSMSAMGDETEWFSFSFFQSIIMNIYYLHNHTQKLSFWLILSFLTEKGRRANSHKFYDVH